MQRDLESACERCQPRITTCVWIDSLGKLGFWIAFGRIFEVLYRLEFSGFAEYGVIG